VRRSKLLPHGGCISDAEIAVLGVHVRAAAEHAKKIAQVTMADDASKAWEIAYADLSADNPGLLGVITARAEAQVLRLALLYALLDCKHRIELDHLRAALALWEYAEDSAIHIFGDALGDPVADEIYRTLKVRGDAGMNRTAIRDLFGRHQSAGRISAALALLITKGRAAPKTTATDGRPLETWYAMS
jgi:hypothetical protein